MQSILVPCGDACQRSFVFSDDSAARDPVSVSATMLPLLPCHIFAGPCARTNTGSTCRSLEGMKYLNPVTA
ncbi:hypothetical protein FA95DRAFT_666813 [Auriscalpium vulgare]|uniref:Uncharacterized protein n=1 Tax=Auriscalpium vulgare TaxID=40419 RepID=A0ACB8S1N8_9AGAM|nr:hypothetical protein FA95DRAFT_666813 [Auriscalpium vulgare]